MKKVEIFTDGACKGNPGPGGWGAILRCGNAEKKISGGEALTTNNRMELTALIKALEALKSPCEITVFSDSKYVVDAISKGWAEKWRQNKWKRGSQKAINPDLWERVLGLISIHKIKMKWLKGHNGHPENEECDRMAVAESHKFNL